MMPRIPRSRSMGLLLGLLTAMVSGVAVFANGRTVKDAPSPLAYTTAKNVVAVVILLAVVLALPSRPGLPRVEGARAWWGLAYVGLVGGGVAFALFFEGLARATSTDAAFLHKTLVVWVALLAVPVLHERVGVLQVGAIGLLVVGQAALGVGVPDLSAGSGELLVLLATLCWAGETVIAKRLLRDVAPPSLGVWRLGVGLVVLLGWLAARGDVGQLTTEPRAWWPAALLTGVILSAYVLCWFGALSRAPAVDVTAVLVVGAVVTAVLQRVVDGVTLDGAQVAGLAVILLGAGVIARAGSRPLVRAVA